MSVDSGTVTVKYPANLVNTDTEVQFTVKPDASDPSETATVWITDAAIECDPDWGPCPDPIPLPVQIVNCPVPTITDVKPSTWFAGKTYGNVVIKGTDFITADKATTACPVTAVSVTAADGSVVPVSAVTVAEKTKITATVAPPDSDPTESATITPGPAPASSSTQTYTAQILGNQIQCDPSMNCTQPVISTTDGSDPPVQNAVVGQPIILTTPALPSGTTATKTTWTVGGTNVGGYAPTTTSGTVTKTVLKNATLNTYWIYPQESIPVSYTYCVNIPGVGNQCSEEADASFNLTGPTVTITPSPTSWHVTLPLSCPTITQYLYFGYPDPTSGCNLRPFGSAGAGISFNAALSNLPVINGSVVTGTTEWVQVILKESFSGVSLSGVPSIPAYYGPGLDNTYPYPPEDPDAPVTTQTSDSPNNSLNPLLSRETRRFKADMYYLWKPQIPGSIFVPLGYVEWSSSGTGVQHIKDSPPWSLAQSGLTTDVFTASSDTGNTHGYPTWSKVIMNTNSNGNENDEEGEGSEAQQ